MRTRYNTKPDFRPTEFADGSGWYVLVVWGDRPSEQVGGFIDEDSAKYWIKVGSQAWLAAQLQERADGF